ncbi:WD40 repeat-like protein [Ascobolus immersus RN42]|uniref:WD40 repeat-like protein n=1 Tax=Ascobolus immersus RN42 TaxID=1160509 RepID=A0A3N4IH25_ASCIM|nr:WD40 repeat-like protein [Ascobolus immersus RN42]
MVSTDRKAGSKQRRRSNRAQAKHKPDSRTPSAATARSIAQWEDNEWKLFVSTASKVSVWDGYTCTRIFSSASEGIVIAKRAKDGSALAIADSQVVVLHKVEEGQPMSYRLKGSEGPCRLLQYSHDSKVLFFTDSIHNTVQSYNIPEGRVSDAGLPHPSPISAFAVSADSNLILSCSETPPVVQLHNRLLGTTSTIVPQASIKPVTTCTFHPTRKHTFILAFKDGIVAAYDSTKLVRAREDNSKKPTKVADHIHKFEHLHDPSVSGNPGVTAIQFIPGYKAKAVSVGEDGRAFVLDFEQKDVQASWHVGAPITSLSIRSSEDHGWLAAVGTVHGMCLVYDSEGKKLCDRAVDSEGAKILGVEWISGEVRMPQLLENDKQVGKVSPLSAPEFKVGNVLARAREQERERQSNSLERIEKPRERQSNSLERTEKLKDYFDTEITRDRALKEQTNSRQPSEKASTSSSLQQEESLKERRSKLRQEQSLTKEESSSRPRQEVPSVKSETSSKHRQESPPAKAESSSKLRQDSTSAKAETSSRHRRELSSVKADASSKHRQDLPLSKADTALKRVDSGPPKLPEFHADGAALMDGVDPHTSDFMSMFSPVKKPSALTLSSSLPDRKPKKARDASDAKESDGDRFDQRGLQGHQPDRCLPRRIRLHHLHRLEHLLHQPSDLSWMRKSKRRTAHSGQRVHR